MQIKPRVIDAYDVERELERGCEVAEHRAPNDVVIWKLVKRQDSPAELWWRRVGDDGWFGTDPGTIRGLRDRKAVTWAIFVEPVDSDYKRGFQEGYLEAMNEVRALVDRKTCRS